MPRFLSFLIFILVAMGILAGMNWLVYVSLKTGFPDSRRLARWMRWVMAGGNLLLLTGIFLQPLLHLSVVRTVGFYWLGLLFIAFSFMLFARLGALIFPGKTVVLIQIALAISLLVFIASIYGGSMLPRVKNMRLVHPGVDGKLEGFKIVHLSDLHLDGSPWKERMFRDVVRKVNLLKADIIVITGDLLDEKIYPDSPLQGIFRELQATHGIYAVTGNHEYYSGLEYFENFMGSTPVKVLRDQRVEPAGGLIVWGIDDDEISSPKKWFQEGSRMKEGIDAGCFTLLLYHRPTFFREFVEAGVDLQLSGHTHGGQIFPFDLAVNLVYRYPCGLYRYKDAFICTSCGTGTWGPRMRTLNRSEIICITLASADASASPRVVL